MASVRRARTAISESSVSGFFEPDASQVASASASMASSTVPEGEPVGVVPTPCAWSVGGVDLFSKLDQRELASGDHVGQMLSLLRVLDLQQLVGMREGVFAHRHQLADLDWRVGQAKAVLEVALVLAELLGKLPDAVPMLADHLVVDDGLIDR